MLALAQCTSGEVTQVSAAVREEIMVQGITVQEWEALTERLFARYDLDGSHTINTIEELEQVTANLTFMLHKAKPEFRI